LDIVVLNPKIHGIRYHWREDRGSQVPQEVVDDAVGVAVPLAVGGQVPVQGELDRAVDDGLEQPAQAIGVALG
jgi:hypothetical protein